MDSMTRLLAGAAFLAWAGAACTSIADDDPVDGADEPFPAGKADGALAAGSPEALAVLELVNDPLVSFAELDHDASLNRLAVESIFERRRGPDGEVGTGDDGFFASLAELDRAYYVGPYALEQLATHAIEQGYVERVTTRELDVVFSPQPYEQSHNVRVAGLIDQAEHSLDLAMHRYSDARITDALESAVDRGVEIRFLFDTAYEDRKLEGEALESSRSGRLERLGVNVRWVNKTMHHKFVIIDGPRDEPGRARTATVVTGSGNWSNGAATRYDENTLFFSGYPELTLRLQAEFDLMWEHSRDVVVDPDLPFELSTFDVDRDAIVDRPETHAYFTSDNFTVTGDTFRIAGHDTVSDRLVAAIAGATDSIDVASGHLRSRPIAEALMAKANSDPGVDIRVYLDGQEHISEWYHQRQLDELEACLEEASTEAQIRNCTDKGFYFGHQVGQSGVDVRYKYYSYRWHYSYAEQMHHKYLIIDGDELWTGSYNLSDNAEHHTFENVLVFRGAAFSALVDAYRANFAELWETGRPERIEALSDEIRNASWIPLVFEPMALGWDEVNRIDALIRDNCDRVDSASYRENPEEHWYCPR